MGIVGSALMRAGIGPLQKSYAPPGLRIGGRKFSLRQLYKKTENANFIEMRHEKTTEMIFERF